MPRINIFSSVGRDGANVFGDVTVVQRLINLSSTMQRPIAEDGRCGPATISAIQKVQSNGLRMNRASGRLEPNDATFNFLTRGIEAEAFGSLKIAWGARVSVEFKVKLVEICENFGVDPNFHFPN